MSTTKGKDIPIIDSHIHLYPASEQSTLAWCSPSHPLSGQHSVDEYLAATRGHAALEGFIFVETDRIHDLADGERDGSGWAHPLAEVSWMRRIAQGEPHAGEGHTADQKHLCLAIVPWAPVPSGAEVLERYVTLVRERAGACWSKVRGFRYLVQYKPRGVMLQDSFIDALRWLGRQGFAFVQGIDTHRDGLEWMDDTLEMIARAHEGVPEEERVTFIIDHLCKPDMTLFTSATHTNVTSHPTFQRWRTGIFSLSLCAKTFMKLSGCFSEIPPSFVAAIAATAGVGADADADADADAERVAATADAVFNVLRPWLAVVLAAFGPSRIMFASDWPVCTLGVREGSVAAGAGGSETGEENADDDDDVEMGKGEGDGSEAWEMWRLVVERMCDMASLGVKERVMLWSGTAVKAYGITELM